MDGVPQAAAVAAVAAAAQTSQCHKSHQKKAKALRSMARNLRSKKQGCQERRVGNSTKSIALRITRTERGAGIVYSAQDDARNTSESKTHMISQWCPLIMDSYRRRVMITRQLMQIISHHLWCGLRVRKEQS